MGFFTSIKQKLGMPKDKAVDKNLESFLALTITPDTVIACAWNFAHEKVEAKGISSKHYANTQNLIHEAAVAIDKAVEAASSDVNKVVFGLSSNWFDRENLKSESSKILESLSRDLDLSSQAYVSLATAVNHFLKMEEGLTPNAVLVGIFENFLEVHLVKNNKVLSTEKINSKAEVGAVVELIKKLKENHEPLPSRIVLYGKSPENLNSRLGSRNWQDIFLHDPKIELLDEKELAKSVAFAQAVDILGYDPTVQVSKVEVEEVESKETDDSESKDKNLQENFGFVAGEDILLAGKNITPKETPEELAAEAKIAEIDHNLQQGALNLSKGQPEDYAIDLNSNIEEPNLSQSPMAGNQIKPKKAKFKIPNPMSVFSLIKFRPSPKSLVLIAVVIIVLAVGGIFTAGLTLTSAQVVIKVNARPQELDFKSQVSSGNSDISSGLLPGNVVTGTAEGNQKLVATGSKKTGTKAKGEIKILNWDKSAPKTFASGTQVITKDGLKFSIDSEIEVASRSATTPGENKVAATAFDIGPKYNINSAIDLTIVGFDEVFYSAVTESAFSGGDEKQITVASQDDLTRLEKSLTDSLTEKAKVDLSAKSEGRKIYDEAKTVKVTKKEFDKKAEEEASLINLNMAIEVSALTFDENDLKTYLAQIAQEKAEKNLESRPENIEILNLLVKSQKDTLILSGRFRANLTPKIDENSLKEKIAGQSTKKAREAIKSATEVSDVQIIISPSIPFIDSLPRNKSKITFKVETQ